MAPTIGPAIHVFEEWISGAGLGEETATVVEVKAVAVGTAVLFWVRVVVTGAESFSAPAVIHKLWYLISADFKAVVRVISWDVLVMESEYQ